MYPSRPAKQPVQFASTSYAKQLLALHREYQDRKFLTAKGIELSAHAVIIPNIEAKAGDPIDDVRRARTQAQAKANMIYDNGLLTSEGYIHIQTTIAEEFCRLEAAADRTLHEFKVGNRKRARPSASTSSQQPQATQTIVGNSHTILPSPNSSIVALPPPEKKAATISSSRDSTDYSTLLSERNLTCLSQPPRNALQTQLICVLLDVLENKPDAETQLQKLLINADAKTKKHLVTFIMVNVTASIVDKPNQHLGLVVPALLTALQWENQEKATETLLEILLKLPHKAPTNEEFSKETIKLLIQKKWLKLEDLYSSLVIPTPEDAWIIELYDELSQKSAFLLSIHGSLPAPIPSSSSVAHALPVLPTPSTSMPVASVAKVAISAVPLAILY